MLLDLLPQILLLTLPLWLVLALENHSCAFTSWTLN